MLARRVRAIIGTAPTFSQRRRRRRIAQLALSALRASGDGKHLAHVLWLFIIGLGGLALRAPELGWTFAPALGLLWALIVTALFDAIFFIIPDTLLSVMLICGVAFLLRLNTSEILAQIAAGLGAYGFFRLVALVYERWRGRPGLGAGDAKLFGVAGLLLGVDGLPTCLLAAVTSSLVSVAIERRAAGPLTGEQVLPFGPHLALGLWLTFVFGPLQWP